MHFVERMHSKQNKILYFFIFVDLMPFSFISFRVSTLYTFTFLLRMLTLYTVLGQGVGVMTGE